MGRKKKTLRTEFEKWATTGFESDSPFSKNEIELMAAVCALEIFKQETPDDKKLLELIDATVKRYVQKEYYSSKHMHSVVTELASIKESVMEATEPKLHIAEELVNTSRATQFKETIGE